MKFSQKCDGEIKCGRNHCETAVTAFDFDLLLSCVTAIGPTELDEQIGNHLFRHIALFFSSSKKKGECEINMYILQSTF